MDQVESKADARSAIYLLSMLKFGLFEDLIGMCVCERACLVTAFSAASAVNGTDKPN